MNAICHVVSPDLQLLVEQAQQGSTSAFAELTRRHFRAVFATALAVTGSAADAEDLAQEALLVAFERLNSCREAARFSGWLRQIVRNLALNHIARRKRRARDSDDAVGEVAGRTVVSTPDARQRLLAELERLTPVQREVVLLHDLDDWTHAEVAETLGISEVMSRQHLFAARKIMRGRLADFAEEDGS